MHWDEQVMYTSDSEEQRKWPFKDHIAGYLTRHQLSPSCSTLGFCDLMLLIPTNPSPFYSFPTSLTHSKFSFHPSCVSPLNIYHDFCWHPNPSSHLVLLYSSNFFCTACCSWGTMMMKNARSSETLVTITGFVFSMLLCLHKHSCVCDHFYPNTFCACPLQVQTACCCEVPTTTYNITGCHNQ